MYDPFAPVLPPGAVQTTTVPQTNPGTPAAPVPNALGGMGAGRHPGPFMGPMGMMGARVGHRGGIPGNWADLLTQRYGQQPGFQPWLASMQTWAADRPLQGDMNRADWRGQVMDWRQTMPTAPEWLSQGSWRGHGG